VLSAFSLTEPRLSLGELAARVGLPKATVHRLAGSLIATGFLEHGDDGRYSLGLKVSELGALARSDLDVVGVCSPALDALAANTMDEFVLFGVEVQVEKGQEPRVTAHIEGGSTLREGLRRVFAGLRRYDFKTVAPHVINVFPKDSLRDRADLLDVKISRLDLVNISPTNFFSNPPRFIPELKVLLTRGIPQGCAIGPGLTDKAPGITLHVGESILREDLNLVTEASIAFASTQKGFASGWVYSQEQFPSKRFPAHSWRALGV